MTDLNTVLQATEAQTAAAKALTDEVNGKITAIDQKVDTTAAAITSGFNSVTSSPMVIYVRNAGNDNNHGLDDSNPVQTIGKAISLIPDGRTGYIYLEPNEVYTLSGDINVNNRAIIFFKKFDRPNLGTHPVINVGASLDATHNHINAQLVLANSSIQFDHVNVTMPSKINNTLPWSDKVSFITLNSNQGGSGTVTAVYHTTRVADGNMLVSCAAGGQLNIVYRSSDVDGNGFVVGNTEQGTAVLTVFSSLEKNGGKLITGLRNNTNGTRNIITNYDSAIA